ncbi:adenylosuccinate lyase [Candidatus Woesebacteria bacterium]|nr:adenylosuccinate lyase [Candidatus Woesebacteria bacterium]
MIKYDFDSLSPLDGRYKNKTISLRKYFSESALNSYRIKIETEYLKSLSKFKIIRNFTVKEIKLLDSFSVLSDLDNKNLKLLENKTHHDVKAIEYFLKSKFEKTSLENVSSFVHFGITSEDINNLAYRLLIHDSLNNFTKNLIINIILQLNEVSKKTADVVILARTHGQAAIPTTFGKEFMVFELRLVELFKELSNFNFRGKFNGAVGGYHALFTAFPKIDWQKFSKEFVESFGFDFIEITTQIAPADDLVKLFSIFNRINNVLLDLNQDIWRYISDGWLAQTGKEKYVGSSTMPQKINPIEFENSEGNLIIANSLFEGFSRKLPISRLQRDLSESTILRNIGISFGYCAVAYESLISGLSKLVVNEKIINEQLFSNYNILLEALQTELRANGDVNAYEKIAIFGKNKTLQKEDWKKLVRDNNSKLNNLTPENYLGLTKQITSSNIKKVEKFIKNFKK